MATPPVDTINTHHLICDFGRHKGTAYTRLPVAYLKWMVGSRHSRADIAEEELRRRGTTTPEFEVSGHAIDRASLSCRKTWHQTREKDEGINSWLHRVAKEALMLKNVDEQGRYRHLGIKFAFDADTVWPILKTVMPE